MTRMRLVVNIMMTDDIRDVPAMVGQICEDPEKEKTRGTVF